MSSVNLIETVNTFILLPTLDSVERLPRQALSTDIATQRAEAARRKRRRTSTDAPDPGSPDASRDCVRGFEVRRTHGKVLTAALLMYVCSGCQRGTLSESAWIARTTLLHSLMSFRWPRARRSTRHGDRTRNGYQIGPFADGSVLRV